mmetsp:Transcript_73825/g.208392  ORF Transcript_73825/g.208392 Transcript_73825/m.208392 type:complete len:206 (+) Transcript_73825:701-1318(+)
MGPAAHRGEHPHERRQHSAAPAVPRLPGAGERDGRVPRGHQDLHHAVSIPVCADVRRPPRHALDSHTVPLQYDEPLVDVDLQLPAGLHPVVTEDHRPGAGEPVRPGRERPGRVGDAGGAEPAAADDSVGRGRAHTADPRGGQAHQELHDEPELVPADLDGHRRWRADPPEGPHAQHRHGHRLGWQRVDQQQGLQEEVLQARRVSR